MSKKQLTAKQLKFIEVYLETDNKSEAYRVAYPNSKNYKEETIWNAAYKTYNLSHVKARIDQIKEEAQNKMRQKYEVTHDRLTREYSRLAFLDFRIFFDDAGQIIPLHEMSDDAAASLAGIESIMVGAGDMVDYIKKIKTYDKIKALGDLAKHLGFFKEDNEQGLPEVVLHDPQNPDGKA